jgi:hypothetical protein
MFATMFVAREEVIVPSHASMDSLLPSLKANLSRMSSLVSKIKPTPCTPDLLQNYRL